MSTRLDSFTEAFDSHSGTCRRTCDCGREFFDGFNDVYDWQDGELDSLRADPKATELQYGVGWITFEGHEYVMDCECWRKRAERIMGFLDSHAEEIAEYLSLEKERKLEEANASPVVRNPQVEPDSTSP